MPCALLALEPREPWSGCSSHRPGAGWGLAPEAECERAHAQASVGTGVCFANCGLFWAVGCMTQLWQREGPEPSEWAPSTHTCSREFVETVGCEPGTLDQWASQYHKMGSCHGLSGLG